MSSHSSLNASPRGSEWKKWDLHIHPPKTKKNDQYISKTGKPLDEFCDKLEKSDVKAFGITDYFSADKYFEFINKFREKYPKSEKIFFPNIELCTSYVVNKANEEVNLHLIFNPIFLDTEEKIGKFLSLLSTTKTIEGGIRVKASELTSTKDYEEATTSCEFIDKALKETFGEKTDLTERVLIITSANNDGIRTETEQINGKTRGKKRKVVITDELDKFSNGFFGNSSNTEHFLDRNRLDDAEEIDTKPVISGCDAHSFQQVDDWLGKEVLEKGQFIKQPTWIKADLTFEGLRQIIFEPADRVFIGVEPEVEIRVRNNPRKYLESIEIGHVKEYDGRCGKWFDNEHIPLNKELVAIIGNKGSGKSALSDIIGLVGNSHNQKYENQDGKTEELFSFLNKDKFLKIRCVPSFEGHINWYSGDPDTRTLNANTDTSIPENVEYLPQKYLEKICANIEDDEFRQKLNKVIFGYVEEKDRHGKSSLEELVDYLTTQIREDIRIAKNKLHLENEKVLVTEKKISIDYQNEIKDKLRSRVEELEAHNKIEPLVVSQPEQIDLTDKNSKEIADIDEKISGLESQINSLSTEQNKDSTELEELKQLRQSIVRYSTSLEDIKQSHSSILNRVGLKIDEILSVSIDYTKLDSAILSRDKRLIEIKKLLSKKEDVEKLQINEAEKIKLLNDSIAYQYFKLTEQRKEIIDQLDKPNRDYQAYLKAKELWDIRKKQIEGTETNPEKDTIKWLKNELEKIVKVYPGELVTARSERVNASKLIFKEKKSLLEFYETIKRAIDEEIQKYGEDLGDYEITIEDSLRFDPLFYENFFTFINQGVKGSFYGSEDGRSKLKDLIDVISDWGNESVIFLGLDEIINHLDSDHRENLLTTEDKIRDIFKQMKQGKNPVEFYDFLFGFDYLQTKYDLKVDEKDLSELSPGERGGLLLIFYLMLDKRDIPLVIDQPEDNLDNKSVYEILVTFLKKAKKRRQIIIATHNPNLAVVADAEQIIHVYINKKDKNDFDFHPGAIENPAVNKKVVDILEGTLPAFDNRRLKYRRQPKTSTTSPAIQP